MKRILSSVIVSAFPVVALAQVYQQGTGIGGLVTLAGSFLNRAVPLLIALAVVYFMFQVFKFAVAGSEEDKGKAKTHMIWGIIGIFVMVSVWGLVAILSSTFSTSGVQFNAGSPLPQIPNN